MGSDPKTINALMKHLRDNCNLQIQGSKHKRQLINYGYYHGYKGYRFFKSNTDRIQYKKFDEVVSVIEFDNGLKSVLYKEVMYLETAIKNIVIDEVIKNLKEVSFDDIYKNKMNDNPSNRGLRKKRLRLRDSIHSSISKQYNGKYQNKMIAHFYDRGDDIPIWSVFEIISFGELANFIACLDLSVRENILSNLDMISNTDTSRALLSNTLYELNGLRNAVAHNSVIFDCRFRNRDPNRNVLAWVEQETGLKIKFDYLIDYICLIFCIMKKLHCGKERINLFVAAYENLHDQLHVEVAGSIYLKLVSSDVKRKLAVLKALI